MYIIHTPPDFICYDVGHLCLSCMSAKKQHSIDTEMQVAQSNSNRALKL